MAFHEAASRSLVKSLSFRMVVICSDLTIILLFTHRLETALPIIVLTNLASAALYYFHERVWNQIHWGKTKRQKVQ
ncbi:MAG TPA: DUF2061 domain-containing protein [Candidatus Saccharimonadales bacterium]|nr:DUF2061 domain-containing protein [Candidatus Saccharimonadales bacterium]